ncbi:acidobacterial duplicated orphan permease [uncultured Clostridium sp.]|nr:acidobacterial duplicated orphan permease [uncultured Clostridium sp.]
MEKRRIWGAIAWFVLLVLLFAVQSNLYHAARNRLPEVVSLNNPEGLGISIQNYLERAKETGFRGSPVWREEGQVEGIGGEVIPANLYFTGEQYAQWVPLDFIRGGYFMDDTGAGNNYAVISSEMALSLFMSDEVVGRNIMINGVSHQICGVFKTPQDIMARLAHNLRQDIYLPMRSDLAPKDDAARYAITTLYVPLEKEQFAANAARTAQNALGDLNITQQQDYRDQTSLLDQGRELAVYCLAIALAFVAGIAFLRQSAGLLADFKTLWGARISLPRSFYRDLAVQGVLCIGLLVLSGILVYLASFQPFIPAGQLPSDSVFNFGHYAQAIITHIQTLHEQPYCFIDNYGTLTNLALYGLDILIGAAAITACVKLSGLVKRAQKRWRTYLMKKR